MFRVPTRFFLTAGIVVNAWLGGTAAAAEPLPRLPPASAMRWDQLLRLSHEELAGAPARSLATNILSHQSVTGDWPKNLDTFAAPSTTAPDRIAGTWDNRATVREIRWLARYHGATGDARAGEAVRRALQHILDAQYPDGGWPQHHPPGDGYHRHITFNDGAMVNLLRVLEETISGSDFRWVSQDLRGACQRARDRGVECVLRCQVRREGRLTIWGAQHEAGTLVPAAARRFEPASLATAESAGILEYLMTLPSPGPGVRTAIESGVRWFEEHGLDGLRLVQEPDGDRRVEAAPGAPRLWARFYDLVEEQPVFCGRDGKPVRRLADIERERRGGYAWYGTWGADVARAHARWADRGR